MGKSQLILGLLLAALICVSLGLVANINFGKAQISGTNVSGTIANDTTWIEANSPYNFTGNVTVANGVTLTIKPGVAVELNNFYLQVDGTLSAIGTGTHQINIDANISFTDAFTDPFFKYPPMVYPGGIVFAEDSNGWNEQTGSGSIIENANAYGIDSAGNLDGIGIIIFNASPKINQNSGDFWVNVTGGSAIISSNDLGTISVDGGSAIISNNTVQEMRIGGANTALIDDNTFVNSNSGIIVSSGAPVIVRNSITGVWGYTGIGLMVYGDANPVIENNTITGNMVGLNIYDTSSGSPSPTIKYNNIYDNSYQDIVSNVILGQRGVFNSTSGNVDASYNFWGTVDLFTINQTIYDYKDDFNLGTVTFTPILTAPNPEATPNPSLPITIISASSAATSTQSTTPNSSISSSQNPTASPNQSGAQNNTKTNIDWTQITMLTMLGIIVALVIVVVTLARKRNVGSKS